MRNIKFVNNGIYHIYNRGVDGRDTYQTEDRYEYFVQLLKKKKIFKDEPLVDILSFCLMNNHFHLILRQKSENGISKFMHRLGVAYTKSFNERYKRTGSLFESTYKARHVDNDGYLFHLFRYVHLSPLKYFQNDWKIRGVADIQGAFRFLEQYKWSSYVDLFLNLTRFGLKIEDDILKAQFNDKFDYNNFLIDWLRFGVPRNLVL